MSKTLETQIEIKGEIGTSFINSFREATRNISNLEQEARQVQRELNRLGNDFRNGKIHQSQYAEETRKLTQELSRLERRQRTVDTLKSKFSSGWNTVKTTASIAAVGAATAGTALAVKSLNVASDFEAQMSKVASKTEATKGELNALTETALELGAKTSLSASSSAIAMDELAAGGMNVNQIIAAMPGIIAGAEASGEDLSLVSSTVSTALSVWGLEAEKASKVSDILAKSANISAASVEDFSYAFKYAGKPAADLGYSLESTAAAISIMTDAGIDGSSAGTSLRSALLKLANPTKKQQGLLDKLGLSLSDSAGNAKPLAKFIGEVDKALSGMSNVDRTAALGTLVGTEAISGFMTLMSAGEDKLNRYTTLLENSAGSSAKASAVMMDNYAGAKEQMLGALESAQIVAATPSLDVLKRTFSGISNMIEDNLPAIEAAGQSVAGVLEEIFAPFILYEEPIKPVITPEMDPNDAKVALDDYNEALSKHNMFGKMDMGDKVDYMLDQTIAHISEWVQGDGGEAIQELFAELASIAAGAWSTSFTTLATGAVSELAEGDIGSAVAMGAAANSMTGGLLMTGGMAGGKYIFKKGKGLINSKQKNADTVVSTDVASNKQSAKSSTTKANTTATNTTAANVTKSNTTSRTSKSGKINVSTPTSVNTVKGDIPKVNAKSVVPSTPISKSMKMVGKVAGKAAMPLTLATGAVGIMTSDNKAEATGSFAGSLAGGLAGAKVGGIAGAAIGSIVPGLGTAIGGAIGTALGGIAGSLGGGWLGGKAGNAIGGKSESTTQQTTQVQQTTVQQPVQQPAQTTNVNNSAVSESVALLNATIGNLNNQATSLNMSVTALNTSFTNTAMQMQNTFTPLNTTTQAVVTNMSQLNVETTFASMGLKSSFTALTNATNLLVSGLNNIATNANSAASSISTLSSIASAGTRVISALNRLEERINNVSIPGGSGGGRLAYE